MMRPPRPKAWSEWPVGWWLKIVVHSLFFSAFFRSLQFPPNLPLDEEEEGFFSSSLQRLPLLIKCKKKLSVLWPFLITCGMWKMLIIFQTSEFSAKKTEEKKRWKELESCLCSREEWGGSFEGCRRLFVLGFLFGLLLYGLVRNVIGIFSLSMKKIYWDSLSLCHRVAFAPLLAVSLQCHNDMVSLFFHFVRLSWPFFAPYPKYVTHVLCHTCSLAVLQSCMSSCDRGTKVSWSNTIPRLSTWSRRCRHVITLLLGKMSWFFYDFRVILVSQTLASQRDRSSELLCVALSFKLFFSTKSNIDNGPRYTCMKVLWGIQKNCVAQLFDGWDHGLFRFLYSRSLIYIGILISIPVRHFVSVKRNFFSPPIISSKNLVLKVIQYDKPFIE